MYLYINLIFNLVFVLNAGRITTELDFYNLLTEFLKSRQGRSFYADLKPENFNLTNKIIVSSA